MPLQEMSCDTHCLYISFETESWDPRSPKLVYLYAPQLSNEKFQGLFEMFVPTLRGAHDERKKTVDEPDSAV
jgi:hypothetical protein